MASSLAALGLCLFGSAAFAQYAGSPQANRSQATAVPPPVRSAYGTQIRPAVPPLPQPAATGTWRPNVAPAPIQEILEFEKEVPQAVPMPAPLPVVQQPSQPEPVRQHAPVIQPAPVVTPASYPQPAPIAVSGPAPIHTQQMNSATPMPAVEKPVELVPVVAPAVELPIQPAPVMAPAVEKPLELPPVVAPAVEKTVELAPVVAPAIEMPVVPAPVAVPVVEKPVELPPVVAPVVEQPVEVAPVVMPAVQPEPASPVHQPEIPGAPSACVQPECQPAKSVALPPLPTPPVATETKSTPTVELPAATPPPVFPDSQPAPVTELPIVAPLPQPWKPTEKPAPAAVAAPELKASEINLTGMQKESAPAPMETGRAPGVPDDGQGNYVQLDPPGPQRLFRLDSEMSLQERMRQEALSRPGQDKTEFPTYKPISDSVFAGRAWPCQTMLVEPSYVNYKPLMFQELNSERYGWDLGFVQPFVSTGYFIKDLVFWPYRRAADGSCCDSGAGYCLPGDPVPYLLYPPNLSLRGAVAEAVVIAALVAIFP
jgi:hypothetical protein